MYESAFYLFPLDGGLPFTSCASWAIVAASLTRPLYIFSSFLNSSTAIEAVSQVICTLRENAVIITSGSVWRQTVFWHLITSSHLLEIHLKRDVLSPLLILARVLSSHNPRSLTASQSSLINSHIKIVAVNRCSKLINKSRHYSWMVVICDIPRAEISRKIHCTCNGQYCYIDIVT